MNLPVIVDASIGCYRVGREPEPLRYAPMQFQTWEGRYDDPDRVWRTLYLADSAYGAWVEVLARFRADQTVTDTLATIASEPADNEPAFGVQLSWLATRRVARAEVTATLVPITHTQTLRWLDRQLREKLTDRGIHALDISAATGGDRLLTQQIARVLRLYANVELVSYISRHGDDITCYAAFESAAARPFISPQHVHGVDLNHADQALEQALRLHDLPLQT